MQKFCEFFAWLWIGVGIIFIFKLVTVPDEQNLILVMLCLILSKLWYPQKTEDDNEHRKSGKRQAVE